MTPVTPAAAADLAVAIRAALDVPYPASLEDWEVRYGRVLAARVAELRGHLAWLAEDVCARGQDAVTQAAKAAWGVAARPLPYEPSGGPR